MKKYRIILLLLGLTIVWQCAQDEPIAIYLIGDSTMADKPLQGNPERGWGQILCEFFNQNVTIYNHAVNGRSTKSFIDEGRWQTVYDSLNNGDYVLIQFGHNDQKEYDSTRYADPHGAYRLNIERFIKESRNKNVIPLLITPVMRRRFDENGQFYDTHGAYPDVVRSVAREMNVPLIDLHRSSRDMIVSEGEEGSKKIFLWVEPGEFERFPQGKQDNTHFSEYGATIIAGLVVDDIRRLDVNLKRYIIESR